jgi:hypothetical protein
MKSFSVKMFTFQIIPHIFITNFPREEYYLILFLITLKFLIDNNS